MNFEDGGTGIVCQGSSWKSWLETWIWWWVNAGIGIKRMGFALSGVSIWEYCYAPVAIAMRGFVEKILELGIEMKRQDPMSRFEFATSLCKSCGTCCLLSFAAPRAPPRWVDVV